MTVIGDVVLPVGMVHNLHKSRTFITLLFVVQACVETVFPIDEGASSSVLTFGFNFASYVWPLCVQCSVVSYQVDLRPFGSIAFRCRATGSFLRVHLSL